MFEAMVSLLKATYSALERSDDENAEENAMFWPDGAKTRNHELDEELGWTRPDETGPDET